jgi:predicted transcriptional regulator
MPDRKLLVRDVMQTEFDRVDRMDSVSKALRILRARGSSAAIVERRNESDEYGLLLVSDIARHVIAQDRNPGRVNVYEIMAKPVLSVHPDMQIQYCARLLQQFDLTRAPVIDARVAVGLVSFDDLVLNALVDDGDDR